MRLVPLTRSPKELAARLPERLANPIAVG